MIGFIRSFQTKKVNILLIKPSCACVTLCANLICVILRKVGQVEIPLTRANVLDFLAVFVFKMRWVLNRRSSLSVTGAKLHSYRLSRKGILIELVISRSPFTQTELWNANKFPGSLNDLLELSKLHLARQNRPLFD